MKLSKGQIDAIIDKLQNENREKIEKERKDIELKYSKEIKKKVDEFTKKLKSFTELELRSISGTTYASYTKTQLIEKKSNDYKNRVNLDYYCNNKKCKDIHSSELYNQIQLALINSKDLEDLLNKLRNNV